MAGTRFFRRGISKIRFAATLASVTYGSQVATRLEITNSVALSDEVADIGGFSLSNSPIAVPDLNSVFTGQIDGEDTVADSSLTFYDVSDTTTIRTALAKGTAGFILLFPYGDVPTKRFEIWPVKSTGYNDQWTVGNDPARAVCGFAVSREPTQDAVIPA